MGAMVCVCSILGLPWVMVSLPHSPMNAQILADTVEGSDGNEIVLKARESRWPGLLSHITTLLVIGFASSWLAKIPTGVAMGFLLYMGTASLSDNQLFERIKLFFTDPNMYPPNHFVRFVPVSSIHKFTLIQAACFLFLWLVHDNFYVPALENLSFSIALLFPLVLVLMIPFKMYVLPRFFRPFDLEMLTQVDEANIAKLVF